MSSSGPGSHGSPPDPNPVLSAYESFVRDTPLVTRYTLTTLTLSYVLSFFVDPSRALSNAVLWSVQRFELYRIVLSPLVCDRALTLVFAYMSFVDQGRRLEHSMGSASFVMLLLTLGGLSNVAFLAIMGALFGLTGDQTFLIYSCYGIWVVILGIIAAECSTAPPGTTRRIFAWECEVKYYPLVLLGFFTILGGVRLGETIGMGMGYAYGYGYLDRLKLRPSTCRTWEDGCLRNFASRPGWVVGTAALGSDAWLPVNTPAGRERQEEGGGLASLFSAPGRTASPQEPSSAAAAATEVAFAGSGRSLGGGGSDRSAGGRGGGRGNASQRRTGASASPSSSQARHSAMLAAAERRASEAKSKEGAEAKQDR